MFCQQFSYSISTFHHSTGYWNYWLTKNVWWFALYSILKMASLSTVSVESHLTVKVGYSYLAIYIIWQSLLDSPNSQAKATITQYSIPCSGNYKLMLLLLYA